MLARATVELPARRLDGAEDLGDLAVLVSDLSRP